MRSCPALLFLLIALGCAARNGPVTLETEGTLEAGDPTDPDYGEYRYDQVEFEAEPLDMVRVELAHEGFSPIVALYEASTGAHIAEWDPAYSDEAWLEYRIAGAGTYQARVYSSDGGTGPYTMTITVSGN